VPISLKSGG